MPRPHRRRPRRQPDPAAVDPGRPDLATQEWLVHEATFHLALTSMEYSTCDTCGRAISFCETVAFPRPRHDQVAKVCWCCCIALLIYRGAIDLAAPIAPDHPLKGRVDLDRAMSQVLLAIDRAS